MIFGITGSPEKENFNAVISILLEKLESNSIEYFVEDHIAGFIRKEGLKAKQLSGRTATCDELFRKTGMVVALGGDGTILRYAREAAFHNKPILGVNLGKLGFLAEVSTGELVDCIDEILADDYNISERILIEGTVAGTNESPFYGLNDIVIDRGGKARVIDIDVYINDDYVITFKGDGIIVGTPTGSTAYSLSCGGPIVAPDTDVLIVTPISPHTLNARPFIIPTGKTIRCIVRSQEQQVPVTADGQHPRFFSTPVEITLRRSDFTAKLVKRIVRSFYDVLREKLMWGKDVRLREAENRIR